MRFFLCGIIVHTGNFKNAVDINGLRIYLALLFLPLKMGLKWKRGSQINRLQRKSFLPLAIRAS